MTIIQIGDFVRVNIEEILDVSDIIPASTEEFNDNEGSSDDEEDWMDRFQLKTSKISYIVTEYDVPNLKETHAKLTTLWLEFTNANVIKL